MVHLVYCDNTGKKDEREIEKIKNGTKTMIQRGATGRKIPHSRVFQGETLYFMEKGTNEIYIMATVTDVKNYVKLTEEEINNAFNDSADKLNLTEKQRTRWHKKCLCFVEFSDIKILEKPLEFEHQDNMDDWLIIEKIDDVLVGKSIPYNYEKSKF